MTAAHAQDVDYSRKRFVMAAVAMGIFLATVDGSIVNVALPTLVEALDTNFATIQWVVLAYLLTLATLLLAIGRLADIYGKKRLYNTGFVVFTLFSVACGLASSAYMLIAMRVLQAVGASMLLALGPALIAEAFPPSERGKALGVSGAVVSVGIVTGPTVGGVLIENLSWHWIFFVNLPIGVVGTWMAWRFVPAHRPAGGQRFDYLGALLLLIGLLALLLALTFGQSAGFFSPRVLALFGAAAVFLATFVLWEIRAADPMIDLRLFRNDLFTINIVTGFLSFIAISGTILLLPFYLEIMRGYSVQQVGLMLAVTPIALGISSPLSGMLSDRVGPRRVAAVGLFVLIIGYWAVSTLSATTTIAGYVARLAPVGLGMGIFQSPNNSAILGAVPRARLGIASGLLALTRTLGQTTGIAVLGAIWAAQVAAVAGGPITGGATAAPVAAQIAGLQATYRINAALIFVAFLLGVWSLVQERRRQAHPAAATVAPPSKAGQ